MLVKTGDLMINGEYFGGIKQLLSVDLGVSMNCYLVGGVVKNHRK